MKRLIATLLSLLLLFSFAPAALAEPEASGSATYLHRLSGNTRYETGLSIAFAMGESFPAAVVACGTNFPDALSGSYLAQKLGAPMLIVSQSPESQNSVAEFLRGHLTDEAPVYVLGGVQAVPESFETALAEQAPGLRPVRLEGANRYETNLKILEAASPDPAEELLICSGGNYPDALSVGSLGLPVLLVGSETLSEAQSAFVAARSGAVTLIGGTGAVSQDIEEQIGTLLGTERLRRIWGSDRYETSRAILQAFPRDAENLVIATGNNFPDGLCAGPFAAALHANLVLTAQGDEGIAALEDYALEKGVREVYVIGGEAALPEGHFAGLDLAVRSIHDRDTVNAYAESLYQANIMDNYTKGGFTWDTEQHKTGWLYYNGFMLEAFLTKDLNRYQEWIREYYRQHIRSDGSIIGFSPGAVDYFMPAVGMIDLINSGVLPPEEEQLFLSGLEYTYHQLENQIMYPDAGDLYCHAHMQDGTLRPGWKNYNTCLDGIYMAQVYLIRLLESVDRGTISLTDSQGEPVTTEVLWNQIYNRFVFVMANMRDQETGLLHHGYSTEKRCTNGIPWSRGIGWFAMAYVEAAEKHPDPEKRAVLAAGFRDLMSTLLQWQDPDSGLWYNVPDSGTEVEGNRLETSGSSMFCYCLLRGYQKGLLDRSFRMAGLRAFTALTETKMSPEGLTDTLIGSGVASTREQYQRNRFVTNEAKGVAGFIMAAQFIS